MEQRRRPRPPGQLRLRVAEEPAGLRCPYCHDPPPRAGPVAVCRACYAPHHADCWALHGACAACHERRRVAPLERPTWSPYARWLLGLLLAPSGLLTLIAAGVTLDRLVHGDVCGTAGGLAALIYLASICQLITAAYRDDEA